MTVNALSNTPNIQSNAYDADKFASANFDDFLKLLTTQLQNQDPTAPTDTNQLTQQIATLSQVEQQIATNKNLQQLIAMFSNTQTGNMVSYIGKVVDAQSNMVSLGGGQGLLGYNLDAPAAKVRVTITDNVGRVVFSGDGSTDAGRNQIVWNGTDMNGNAMPDGTYKFKIDATDTNGKAVGLTSFITGQVSSVDNTAGVVTLSIAGQPMPVSSILSIRDVGISGGGDDNSNNSDNT